MKDMRLPWYIDEEDEYIRDIDDHMLIYLENAEDVERAKFIIECCNNYKALETTCTNLQAEYEEMASIAYSKAEELERLKNRIDELREELRTEQALRGE